MSSVHNSIPPGSKTTGGGTAVPSVVLQSLPTACTTHFLLDNLSRHLGPVLDSLTSPAEREKVVTALQAIRYETAPVADRAILLASIAYNTHYTALNGYLRDLNEDVRANWKEGYEEQGESMHEIKQDIAEWLPDLWDIGVEDGREVNLILNCLELCTRTVQDAMHSGSRSEFSEVWYDTYPFRREKDYDSEDDGDDDEDEDENVYDADDPIERVINWVWKELLVSSAARGQTTDVKAILNSIKLFGLTADVFDLFPAEGKSTAKGGWHLHNDHWSQAMKDAGRRLLADYRGRA